MLFGCGSKPVYPSKNQKMKKKNGWVFLVFPKRGTFPKPKLLKDIQKKLEKPVKDYLKPPHQSHLKDKDQWTGHRQRWCLQPVFLPLLGYRQDLRLEPANWIFEGFLGFAERNFFDTTEKMTSVNKKILYQLFENQEDTEENGKKGGGPSCSPQFWGPGATQESDHGEAAREEKAVSAALRFWWKKCQCGFSGDENPNGDHGR